MINEKSSNGIGIDMVLLSTSFKIKLCESDSIRLIPTSLKDAASPYSLLLPETYSLKYHIFPLQIIVTEYRFLFDLRY